MQHFLEEIYPKVPTGLKKFCEENNIINISQIKKCICGNYVGFNKAYSNRGFNQFCGPKCSRKNKTIDKEIEIKLSSKEWLYNQRITLKKSKEVIAQELNISISPVNKWIKIHQIPEVRYNESDYSVQMSLKNKENIEDLYINQKLKINEIAELLGSSTATVSRFLQKHQIQCRSGNDYERSINRCSKAENEIKEFISSLGIDFLANNRSIFKEEIDIYIPSHKLAIEYNGLYWHSDKFKDKFFHKNKTDKCNEQGITLFHIWEDDWKSNPSLIKSMIKHKLNLTEKRFYARKCIIKPISTSETRVFLSQNHIQGYAPSTIKLGLYSNDLLVAVCTFNKPRFNKKYDYELVRYATLQNTSVIGGFSKLLKSFIKLYNTNKIVTYADLSYSEGNVYTTNGFKQISITQPSYWYVTNNMNKRVNRTTFMKSKLPTSNINMSEKNIIDILDIPRIWNCGMITYELV